MRAIKISSHDWIIRDIRIYTRYMRYIRDIWDIYEIYDIYARYIQDIYRRYTRYGYMYTIIMKICGFLRAWIVIEVFERIPAKVSPSNVSWTSLFCISYVRGLFVIKEMLNFLTGNFLFFPISYFPVKTNHFQALRAPVIRAHKIVNKSLLSSWKISLN